jgi:Ca2+-binding EF-hand superfamily protein
MPKSAQQHQTIHEDSRSGHRLSAFFTQIFEMYDDNKSDDIDFDEFMAILTCVSSRFKLDLAKELFAIFDISQNGIISKAEFKDAIF